MDKKPIQKTYKTFCPKLWDEVFINPSGEIFSCCHDKPGILGNIYKTDLHTVWTKNNKLKVYRLLSLKNRLFCFLMCNLLEPNQTQAIKNLPYPKRIKIEYGQLCNLRCIMCRQDHRSKTMLNNEILKENIQWSRVQEITLQGGEILCMKNAKEFYLWLTKTLRKKVDIITNGSLINDEWAEHLIRGSNWIQLSINAATKNTYELISQGMYFNKVIDTIKKLVHLNKQNFSKTKIKLHYTIIPENFHEIPDAILLADALGCDEISFSYDPSLEDFLLKNPLLKVRIQKKINKLINEGQLDLQVMLGRFIHLGIVI